MSGRKPAVAPTKVIEVVLQFKDRIVRIDENDEKSKYTLLRLLD